MGWIADLLKEIPSAARYKAELEQLASEHEAMKAKNAVLTSQLETAQHEIERLSPPSGSKRHSDRPAIERRILVLLSTVDSMRDDELVQQLGIGQHLADHHVGELLRADFIFTEATYDEHGHWQLTRHGLAYLAERGLIQ
jgi:hypothetical protein